MSLPIVFRLEAQTEFDEALDWYEQQLAGLGLDFLDCVADVLVQIESMPESYQMVFEDIPPNIEPNIRENFTSSFIKC